MNRRTTTRRRPRRINGAARVRIARIPACVGVRVLPVSEWETLSFDCPVSFPELPPLAFHVRVDAGLLDVCL